jgi:uroporphyrin-III C-methyltransferase/precorrin-2 dehydrogenase/sirohydrochlorin ferrochelatase
MAYLPLFHDFTDKTCLVVGGSDVALRKCRVLARFGVNIRLVGLEIIAPLKLLVTEHGGTFDERAYDVSDLDGISLVVAATCVEEVNKQIHSDATKLNLPVNVVDQPDLCSFIFPSIIDRDPITVAISSGGQSPVLARLLRASLETMIPPAYGKLSSLAGKFRDRAKEKFSEISERRKFWENVLQGPIAEMVFNGKQEQAEEQLLKALDNKQPESRGEVYLVGAGPGDPDLLTFRALRLMQQADIIFYDNLVSQPILDLARKDATQIYVGKKKADHSMPQENLNQALVEHARQGLRVLRLKGGDPFIFGRGGEEIAELAEHNIPFQVVPGITAASGCAAYAGIPLTHRDHAQSVRFLTGHLKEGTVNLHWPELMDTSQTLVFYMGLTGIKEICHKLVEHGRDKHTPVALVEKGTTEQQRVFISTLEALPDIVSSEDIRPPTLTIVGDVVTLQDKLKWYNH